MSRHWFGDTASAVVAVFGLLSLALGGCHKSKVGQNRPGASSAATPSLLFAVGCSSASSTSGKAGAVGSHVWFASSVSLKVKHEWSFDSWGPDAGPSDYGSRCWKLDRKSLSAAQLAALKSLVLVPITDACTSDGYDYTELTVTDADGSTQTYRDTGRSFLAVPGAVAMLPQNAFDSTVFPSTDATTCPN